MPIVFRCFSLWATTSVIVLVLMAGSPATAQQDPFDGADTLFGDAPAADTASAEDVPAEDDPIARQLLERAGRGRQQMAESISALARTGRWSEVDRLLASLADQTIDANVRAEMWRAIGPTVYLKIKSRSEVGDQARKALDQMATAATARAESPERLQAAIDALNGTSADDRLAATRVLLGGGNAAIESLVAAAVADPPTAPLDDVLRTLLQIDPSSTAALRQLALYGAPEIRGRAIEALTRIARTAHIVDFVTALHAVDATSTERAAALAALSGLSSGQPNRPVATAILQRDLQQKLETARRIANDQQTQTLWSINEQRDGVSHQTTTALAAAYRATADAAARLRRLGNHREAIQADILAADLAYRLIVDPDWGSPDQVQSISDAYGTSLSASLISTGLDQALGSADYPAAVGLVRAIAALPANAESQHQLLRSGGSVTTPLVQAASSAEPRVRYEAAAAATRVADGSRYPGSSLVAQTLAEMQRLGDQPTAILVETRADTRLQMERLLSDLGFRVETATSVAQLERVVARGGDLRLILSKTELPDSTAVQMIDLIRRRDRGRNVPILLYGADTGGIGLQRWSAPTLLIEPPKSTLGLGILLDDFDRQRRLPALSVVDRQAYRNQALSLLTDPEVQP